jgi:hypothetical protein
LSEENNVFFENVRYLKKIGSLIRQGKLQIEEVKLYLDLKIDIDKLMKLFDEIYRSMSNNETELLKRNVEYLLSTPSSFFDSSRGSLLAPAYNLNNYLDTLNEYTINRINNKIDDKLEIYINICVQTLFISIKTALDRLVPLMTFYYPGISLDSTFGRIKSNGKYKGFMSKVVELKDDPLMKYIKENYDEWIKSAVSPRDMLTHYNDFSTRYQHTLDGRMIPIHVEKKTFQKFEDVENLEPGTEEWVEYIDNIFPTDYSYKDLSIILNKFYTFLLTVLNELSKKEVVFKNQHFQNEKGYLEYKKSCKE